jgi:hypothetical protein
MAVLAVMRVVRIMVMIVGSALLVHEAIPGAITVLGVGHCPYQGIFLAARFTSFQNISSFVVFAGLPRFACVGLQCMKRPSQLPYREQNEARCIMVPGSPVNCF